MRNACRALRKLQSYVVSPQRLFAFSQTTIAVTDCTRANCAVRNFGNTHVLWFCCRVANLCVSITLITGVHLMQRLERYPMTPLLQRKLFHVLLISGALVRVAFIHIHGFVHASRFIRFQ
ncbi:hypothetical protein TRVL_09114 [Trypanosoma vivax]|nr:hypothetical protein TRVL_09114 [Trypanosoma vivax]